MKHKFIRVSATAFMMLAALSITAFAATLNVNWTKVKLTNKGNAQWNLDLGEAGKKRSVDYYEVQVYAAEGSLAGYGSFDEWDIIETADRTRHEKLVISDPGTYKFKVRAVMNDGDVTNWSQESNQVTFTAEKIAKLGKKAEREKKKAEREAKKAERAAKKAEREVKKAEREAKKAEREQNKAEREARKAEREARKAERAKKNVTNADGRLKRGWEQTDGVWKYYDQAGSEAVGWLNVRGHWYYLDEDGEMMTGWIRNDGKLYYLDETGAMVIGDVNVEGVSHSFDASGAKTDANIVDELEVEDTEATGVTVEN